MRNRSRYLTPNAAAGVTTCRRLVIPVELIAHVSAALYDLTLDYRWDDLGTMTIEEATELCRDMWLSWLEDECMIGAMIPYAGTLPGNCLPCDGQSYNRVDYPKLYAKLNAVFITGPDTFVTPDMRGRGIIGAGTGPGLTARSIGDTGGGETHQLTVGELPTHDHTTHQHGVDLDVEGPAGLPQPVTGYAFASVTGSTGSNQPHENMPPFGVGLWGIVAL